MGSSEFSCHVSAGAPRPPLSRHSDPVVSGLIVIMIEVQA